MIYRILIDQYFFLETRMGGVAGGLSASLSEKMDELGLAAPKISTPRARFYFTEYGWRRVGQAVATEAKRRGHVVRVIRQKNPRPSQIVYQDALQLALLPDRRSADSAADP
jgi:hypothetical protein